MMHTLADITVSTDWLTVAGIVAGIAVPTCGSLVAVLWRLSSKVGNVANAIEHVTRELREVNRKMERLESRVQQIENNVQSGNEERR